MLSTLQSLCLLIPTVQESCEVDMTILFKLKIQKLKLKEVKWLTPGQTHRGRAKIQTQVSVMTKPVLFYCLLHTRTRLLRWYLACKVLCSPTSWDTHPGDPAPENLPFSEVLQHWLPSHCTWQVLSNDLFQGSGSVNSYVKKEVKMGFFRLPILPFSVPSFILSPDIVYFSL